MNENMENTTPSYWAQISAEVRYDKELKPMEKLMYGELSALTNLSGYCWASDTYFAELYEVSRETVSRWINKLAKKNYIRITKHRQPDGTVQRRIWLTSSYERLVAREANQTPKNPKPKKSKTDSKSAKASKDTEVTEMLLSEISEEVIPKVTKKSHSESDEKVTPKVTKKSHPYESDEKVTHNTITNKQIVNKQTTTEEQEEVVVVDIELKDNFLKEEYIPNYPKPITNKGGFIFAMLNKYKNLSYQDWLKELNLTDNTHEPEDKPLTKEVFIEKFKQRSNEPLPDFIIDDAWNNYLETGNTPF